MKLSRTRKFLRLPSSKKLVLLEACFILLLASAACKLLPYSLWSRLVAGPKRAIPDSNRKLNQEELELVAWGVQSAASSMRLFASCLPNALTGKLMLARRKIPNEIVLGIADNLPSNPIPEFHCWLKVNGEIVIGGERNEQFKPVTAL